MRALLSSLALSLALLPLAGCSDSGSGSGPTGYVVGGLVENLPYSCGSLSGRTGRIGQFTYEKGEGCTFTLGGLVLPVSAAALEDGAVTPYDMTATREAAWTLTAIMDAISYRRPGSDVFTIVDGILTQRLPRVDLARGDEAIATALAPYSGTVDQTTVASGRARIGEFVDEENVLRTPLDELVAEGEAALARLGVPVEQGEPPLATAASSASADPASAAASVTNNVVNLRVYDYAGNPLTVQSVSYQPGQNDSDWLSVTAKQNKKNAVPVAGLDNGDIQGPNVFGISFEVARKKSDQVGQWFQNTAMSPGTWQSPVTIMAYGATDNQTTDTYYPDALNFGYHIDLTVNTSAGTFQCPNVILGQGSSGPSLKDFLNLTEDIADTVFDGFEFVASDGAEGGDDTVQSFGEAVAAAFKIKYQNWWILGLNAQDVSYRTNAWTYPVILMQCIGNGQLAAVLGYSDYDDHTFNLQVSFPGQPITVSSSTSSSGS